MPKKIVGWFLPRVLEARAVWFDPIRYLWKPEREKQSDMFMSCPAYQNFTQNLFVILSPFDLHLKCRLLDDGCEITIGEKSSIRPEKLSNFIKVHPKNEWREPDKPLMQFMLNYYFLSDDDIDIQYLSPLTTHYFDPPLPGLVLQGRWNIKSWVRPINFVFEWRDTSSDLIIQRGTPILNVIFLAKDYESKIKMIEAEETDDVVELARNIQNISSFIRNVFSVLPSIEKRRPRRIVKSCKRDN